MCDGINVLQQKGQGLPDPTSGTQNCHLHKAGRGGVKRAGQDLLEHSKGDGFGASKNWGFGGMFGGSSHPPSSPALLCHPFFNDNILADPCALELCFQPLHIAPVPF